MAAALALLALLVPPALASAVAALIRPYHRAVGWVGLACAAASLVAALALCGMVLTSGPVGVSTGPAAAFRVDAVSALVALCIALVYLITSALAPGLEAGADLAPETRRLRVTMAAFAFTMLLAVTLQNVALMWVAIEATTIASALAIPIHRTRASVEASWKYLLVCSVGIALAFTGTILAYFDFVSIAGDARGSLNWTALRGAAPGLHPALLQVAFAFILVGYGTKAGLAPMHTWLPDAHSEAPSPISAMMSGVLLAVAMYAIARWKAVVDAAVSPAFTNGLLIGFGLVSIAIGALTLVLQRHYKRMLAYSSVEHMGLVAVGLGLGPLGAFAAWLHVVNHAIAKSACFLLAGRILHRYRTTEIAGVTGLLRVMPWTGALFVAGVLALAGLPPFGMFVSEYLLVRATIADGKIWLGATILALLLTAFISLLGHVTAMAYGEPPAAVERGERHGGATIALALAAAATVVLGIVLPSPLSRLLDETVSALLS
jgi:hydrogenase-4 component F